MMKSLLSLPLLLLLPVGEAAAADAPGLGFSASGGVLVSDNLEVIAPGWVIMPRLNYWLKENVSIDLEIGYGSGQTRIGVPETFGYTVVTPRLGVTGRVFEDQPVNLLMGLGLGAWIKSIRDDGALELPTGTKADLDLLANAGPGLFLPFGDSGVGLRTDLRFMLSMGSESYANRGDVFLNWEWTGGIAFGVPMQPDTDKDGIVDADDECDDEPEDIDEFEDTNGCPDPDNDGDTIADAEDQCADTKEDLDEFEDTDGCLDEDNDQDGVVDGDDTCVNEAGKASAQGCPDADEDSLADADDECPDEKGTKNGFGCPDQDNDRVPDHRDECPDKAANEKINPLRSDGCPSRVYFADKALVITETIEFDTGKATIKKASEGLLQDIAKVLQKYPGVKELQIEGHTDDQGDDAKNLKLSEDRAQAVRSWLVEKGGIEEKRLLAKGVGEAEPIADNATEEGRTQNRRVEFEILAEDMPKGFKRKMKEKIPEVPAEGDAKAPEAPAGEDKK